MSTKLEQALDCMVQIYHKNAILDPVDDYLHPKEFRKLMKEEAQPFLKNTKPPNLDEDAYIQQLFIKADKDKNGCLRFEEFLTTFFALLDEAHERSHDLDGGNKSGHGHGHGPGHSH